MCAVVFNREEYYSQTEAIKLFKANVKRFKQFLIESGISVAEKEITLHTSPEGVPYKVITKYVLKSEFNEIIKNKK
jgi:hypothetical protein